ncbi:YhcN/YlaJ family sporulation lipoprotein [Halobacillus litoralis]|uniref:YhcN/YlaJ family sporulation lipoprotein n=1 Tax=Halobacillus litoralis TaxID=45668 RepID=UPI001CD1E4C5|nr:YhcN/YlaJ family sporulation lipoprotein [Halobacillus litoralis]MCA0971766.1 YhcN/YlaJ family sporulation lipoprotein [Halobacillus litoralis]
MMKFMIPILAVLLIMTGCMEDADKQETSHHEDALNGNPMDSYNEAPLEGQVGYVRYNKDQLDQDVEQNREIQVNREEMSDQISRMILRYKGFEDVATLVTDYEILVAYKKPDNMDRELAADMVQKTAYSMVPAFYRIYTSDKPSAFGDIQSVSTSTVYDDQYREVIDSIINKMKEAPQGKVEQNDDQMGTHGKTNMGSTES